MPESRVSGIGYRVAGSNLPTPALWTFQIDQPHPGWLNMSIDSALLDLAEQESRGFLRLYRWDPFCLSFGRHEPATRRYDRARIEALGLDTVRRPTGGRAVWHAREVTYAVAAPLAFFGGLRQAYQAIHRLLAEALVALGIPAVLAAPSVPPRPGAGPCFASPVGGEVLVHGRKVVGSAQLRQGAGFLQHGSLLLEDDQGLLDEITLEKTGRRPPATGHRYPLGRPISFEEIAGAVAAVWGVTEPPSRRVAEPPSHWATAPHARRFQSPQWTWER